MIQTTTPWNTDRHLKRRKPLEQRQLELMFNAGECFANMAQELHRTEHAIIGRLKDMKLIYWNKETETYQKNI